MEANSWVCIWKSPGKQGTVIFIPEIEGGYLSGESCELGGRGINPQNVHLIDHHEQLRPWLPATYGENQCKIYDISSSLPAFLEAKRQLPATSSFLHFCKVSLRSREP